MARSAFCDIADTPEEAANLTARSLLMIAIEQRIKEQKWTQTEAAARLHVTQPRVSDLMTGKLHKFSLDALVNMLPAVGLMVDVRPIDGAPDAIDASWPLSEPLQGTKMTRAKRPPAKVPAAKRSPRKAAAAVRTPTAR